MGASDDIGRQIALPERDRGLELGAKTVHDPGDASAYLLQRAPSQPLLPECWIEHKCSTHVHVRVRPDWREPETHDLCFAFYPALPDAQAQRVVDDPGVAVPDEPFPHANNKEEFRAMVGLDQS